MDALIIKPLPLDLPNFLGRESWEKSFLAAGVLRFQRNHPILQEFLYYMRDKFDGNDWGANGPKLVTEGSRLTRLLGPEKVALAKNCIRKIFT